MLGNEFAADRSHASRCRTYIADGGVYRFLRHPMYLGFLLFSVGSMLWLGYIQLFCLQ